MLGALNAQLHQTACSVSEVCCIICFGKDMEGTCWPEYAALLPKDVAAAGVKPQAGAPLDAAAGPASHPRKGIRSDPEDMVSANPAKQQETMLPEART